MGRRRGGGGGAARLAFGSFNAGQPTAFYLLENRKDMEALSDATLVVQGTRLPVHSQVGWSSMAACAGASFLQCFPAPHRTLSEPGAAQHCGPLP